MNRELEEALKELALEIAQCYATIEQQKAVMRQALDDICGAKLCEVNSMSSRAEARRLLDKATATLREALED